MRQHKNISYLKKHSPCLNTQLQQSAEVCTAGLMTLPRSNLCDLNPTKRRIVVYSIRESEMVKQGMPRGLAPQKLQEMKTIVGEKCAPHSYMRLRGFSRTIDARVPEARTSRSESAGRRVKTRIHPIDPSSKPSLSWALRLASLNRALQIPRCSHSCCIAP